MTPKEPVLELTSKTYKVMVGQDGHNGDEVYLTGDDQRFRIHSLGDEERMVISYKSLHQFVNYFRRLADRIELLEKHLDENMVSDIGAILVDVGKK